MALRFFQGNLNFTGGLKYFQEFSSFLGGVGVGLNIIKGIEVISMEGGIEFIFEYWGFPEGLWFMIFREGKNFSWG